MKIIPHLGFDGQCETAFKFYEKCFGGTLGMMMNHGDSPIAAEVPNTWHPRILHAELMIGDQMLFGADAPPGQYSAPAGFAVTLGFDSLAEAERVFNALADGGSIQMPFQATFWAKGFGMTTDRFGTPWMINFSEIS